MDVLRRTHLDGCVCETAHSLCTEFQSGASVIMLTEEALEDPGIGELMECLRAQPAWSDIPVLLFADAERSEIYLRTLRLLEGLRNVVLLERPIRLGAALSLIRSAMRGRERQYELRDLLKAFADAREDAETANRLKDEFLATLSHELRTPLNAILGWTTMLRDGNVQPRHVIRALDTIHRNATAQVQIVNDLLDVSRIVRRQRAALAAADVARATADAGCRVDHPNRRRQGREHLNIARTNAGAGMGRSRSPATGLLEPVVERREVHVAWRPRGRHDDRGRKRSSRRCRRYGQRHRTCVSSRMYSSGSGRAMAARRARTAGSGWACRSGVTSSSSTAAA